MEPGIKEEKQIPTDGSCQFASIACIINNYAASSFHSSTTIRDQVHTWLLMNPTTPGGVDLKEFIGNWDYYLEKISQPTTWGDHFTLIAVSELFQSSIMVLSSVVGEQFIVEINPSSLANPPNKIIYLAHLWETHYTPLFIDTPTIQSGSASDVTFSSDVLERPSNSRHTIGETTCRKWFKSLKRYSIAPAKTDYCDSCHKFNQQIERGRVRIMRLQNSNPNNPQIQIQEQLVSGWSELRVEHKKMATAELKAYHDLIKKVKADSLLISQQQDPVLKRALIRHAPQVISADYQEIKTIPYFGATNQPAKLYYRQKLAIDTLGVIDHNAGMNHIYLSSQEAVGKKNANQAISCLEDFRKKSPSSIGKLQLILCLDGAPYFKNMFVLAWLYSLVVSDDYRITELRLLIPGHTKFLVDALFGLLCWKTKDIFNIAELLKLWEEVPKCFPVQMDVHSMKDFKSVFERGFTTFPGITKAGHFRFRKV